MSATTNTTTHEVDLWLIVYRNAIHMKYFHDIDTHCRVCHSQAEYNAALKQLNVDPDKEILRCLKLQDNLTINLPVNA